MIPSIIKDKLLHLVELTEEIQEELIHETPKYEDDLQKHFEISVIIGSLVISASLPEIMIEQLEKHFGFEKQ